MPIETEASKHKINIQSKTNKIHFYLESLLFNPIRKVYNIGVSVKLSHGVGHNFNPNPNIHIHVQKRVSLLIKHTLLV